MTSPASDGPGVFARLAAMERLRTLGYVFAFLMFGAVVICLYGAFRIAFVGDHVIAFSGALLLAILMVWIFLKVALVPDRRYTAWVKALITNINARYLFGILMILWLLGMGFLASMNLEATQVGGYALLGLFAGIFIFMGFIWSVIGE